MFGKPTRSLGTILCAVLILLCSGTTCKRTADSGSDKESTDLLLKDDDIIGLKKSGSYRYANDLNSLCDIIDGGAQKYVDNGLEEALFQTYQYESSTYVLEVYNQSNNPEAKVIYDEFYPPSAEVFFSGTSREAVVNQSLVSSYSIQYYQDKFFVRINTSEKTDAALNMAKLICSNVSGKIE